MGKVLGSWNGMRKYLGKDMPAGCLRGRIRYGCIASGGMAGIQGYWEGFPKAPDRLKSTTADRPEWLRSFYRLRPEAEGMV